MKPAPVELFATAALWLTGAPAADVAGSRDHQMISRYQGSSIINYQHHEFDEYGLLVNATGAIVSTCAIAKAWGIPEFARAPLASLMLSAGTVRPRH